MRFAVIGKVHPERADINLSVPPWQSSDGGVVTIRCEASQLCVFIEHPSINDPQTAFVTADHVARAVISALGFSLGSGYSVELINVVEEATGHHVFGVRPGNLHFEPYTPVLESAFELVKRDLFFRFALMDYVSALREAIDCAFLCYRAIEAIKSAYTSWDIMHDILGTYRGDIDQRVKAFADPVRHGNWITLKPTTAEERNAMLICTRDVLVKYLNRASGTAYT